MRSYTVTLYLAAQLYHHYVQIFQQPATKPAEVGLKQYAAGVQPGSVLAAGGTSGASHPYTGWRNNGSETRQ